MTDIVAAQDLYMNADQDACVTAKSGDAAYLLAREGREVPRTHTQYVTQDGNPKQTETGNPKEQAATEDKEQAAGKKAAVKKAAVKKKGS